MDIPVVVGCERIAPRALALSSFGQVCGAEGIGHGFYRGRMEVSFPHTTRRYVEVYSGVQVVSVM